MSDIVQISMPTTAFEKALARRKAVSKKNWQTVFRTQMRSFIKKIVAATPPGYFNDLDRSGKFSDKIFTKAKWRGENAISKDLSKLFATSRKRMGDLLWKLQKPKRKEQSTPEFFSQAHKRFKNSRGAIRVSKPQYAVFATPLNRYKKHVQKHVGFMMAGWKTATNELNVKLKPWIDRHSNAGGVVFRITDDGECYFEARNSSKGIENVRHIERAIAMASEWEARNIMKQVRKFEFEMAGKI